MKSIPVIDIFAGPGGLGEGFSSFRLPTASESGFYIALSIEMDAEAHKTLELRSFYRKFGGTLPDKYHDYLRCCEHLQQFPRVTRDELFKAFPEEAKAAQQEAWKAELGSKGISSAIVDKKITRALNGASDWVLIGGPPCQAYSLVGRSRMRRIDADKFAKDHRHLLYKQYLQILQRHRPSAFILENVKGILSSQLNGSGIFERITRDLRNPTKAADASSRAASEGYTLFPFVDSEDVSLSGVRPQDFIIRCENYGIPQARHRVLILGIRNDVVRRLEHDQPNKLTPANELVTLREAIGGLPRLRSRISGQSDQPDSWEQAIRQLFTTKRLDKVQIEGLASAITNNLAKLRGSLPTQYCHQADQIQIYNHATRRHMDSDLARYFYAACFAQIHPEQRSPKLGDFPPFLHPKHKNLPQALNEGKFDDRFRVQVWDRPSTTITAHLAKDGHYFIHPDPLQCRSLTVREAARLQTFPDDYFFEGTRTSQYRQVGNAVPPRLAEQLAEIVHGVLSPRK